MKAPDPVPAPVVMSEAEAVTTLRTIARLHGGYVARLYRGQIASPTPRQCLGYAVMGTDTTAPWRDDLATWVYDFATGQLRWRRPNALCSDSPYVTWRGIDDPDAPR